MTKPPIEEPELKPDCCGQKAKWVIHSVNLHYFYCEVCKKEVPPRAHCQWTHEAFLKLTQESK